MACNQLHGFACLVHVECVVNACDICVSCNPLDLYCKYEDSNKNYSYGVFLGKDQTWHNLSFVIAHTSAGHGHANFLFLRQSQNDNNENLIYGRQVQCDNNHEVLVGWDRKQCNIVKLE